MDRISAGDTTTTEASRETQSAGSVDVCVDEANTWTMEAAKDKGDHRWFTDGIEEIKKATTPEEAKEAAYVWANKVKKHPTLFAAGYKSVTGQDLDTTLLEKDGCATTYADQKAAELELALAKSQVVPAEAPANGYNTGVNANGEVVQAAHPGISGERKSLQIIRDDGCTVYILGRCGQIYTIEKCGPEVPVGQTDQPEQPQETTSTTRRVTTTVPEGDHDETTTTTLKRKTPTPPATGKSTTSTTVESDDPEPTTPGTAPRATSSTTAKPAPTTTTTRTPATTGSTTATTRAPQPAPTSSSTSTPPTSEFNPNDTPQSRSGVPVIPMGALTLTALGGLGALNGRKFED
jgi:hypothetical protein